MDGLFIDSEPDWHAAESEMMRSYGYDWTPADQLKCLGGPLLRVTQYMSDCLDGARSAEELGLTIVAEMKKRVSKSVTLMPGALEFSRKLKEAGIPQALVSASPREIVDAALIGMKEKYFSFSVASGDIERTKPFPDPYLHAAKLLGVAIENSLIFEDSPTGLTAARASGAVRWCRGRRWRCPRRARGAPRRRRRARAAPGRRAARRTRRTRPCQRGGSCGAA